MTTIIALMGPAGSGKSSAAAYLLEKHGAVRYSFAAPLKAVAMRTLEFTPEQVYGTQAQKEAVDPRYGFSPRWFLKRLGTEGCRAVFGEDFWATMLIEQIRREAPTLAVIDDCRFVNEAKAVRAFGAGETAGANRGTVWLLESPGCDTVSTDDGSHRSEQEWQIAPVDYRIKPPVRNLDLLHEAIDAFMQHDARMQRMFREPWPAITTKTADAVVAHYRSPACTGWCEIDGGIAGPNQTRCGTWGGCCRPGCPARRDTLAVPSESPEVQGDRADHTLPEERRR